jgi:hypothetical protein
MEHINFMMEAERSEVERKQSIFDMAKVLSFITARRRQKGWKA